MNIVFFGSSQYSVIVAEKLHAEFGLSLVVTKPGPVVQFAEKHSIPLLLPSKLTAEIIAKISRPDFLVAADYGLIIPQILLDLPKYAPLNIHHSLLPKYRGPTPAPSAILAGEKITGVSIIKMIGQVDAGDILAQKEFTIKPDETANSLLKQLNTLGAEILIHVIENYQDAIKHAKKQDESLATYTPRLTRKSGYIEISNDKFQMTNFKSKEKEQEIGNWKLEIDRMVRAYFPWPGVWTKFRIKNSELRIKILPGSAFPVIARSQKRRSNPDEIATLPSVARNDVNILIQVEGNKPMTIKDFKNGYPIEGKELAEKLELH